MKRAAYVAALALSAAALTACGSTPDTSPPGPLGITGSGWFLIIIIGLMVLGGAVSDLAARGRRERRKDRDGDS